MSDAATKSHPRRAVEILTRQNHEKWFKLMKQWLKGEELWGVVDPENAITTPAVSTPESSVSGTISLGKDVGFGGGKLDARAQYQLINCIDDDDQELVTEETTAREI